MPLYHSSACIMAFSHCVHVRCTSAIGRKFSNKTFWPEVRKHDATIIHYVGETCRYLVAAPPQIDPVTGENLDTKHRVRVAFGNGLRPDIWNRFKERFNIGTILEFYAATEGSMATFNLSKNDFSLGAVGRNGWLYELVLRSGMTLVRLDPDTDLPYRDPKTGFCQRVRGDEAGELLFNLPATDTERRFQGYYGNKAATESKIMRDVFKRGDVWLRMGDVMRWDTEGRIFFQDRVGDTFRWKAENVSTTEVADVLGRHPAVQEANVYGVQIPHHDGRAGCVALQLAAAGSSPDAPMLASLAGHVRQGLPRYALPIFLRIVRDSSAYATGTNKQQKHVLRSQGVAPDKVGQDEVYWFRNGTYERFSQREWDELNGGRVKL